MLVNDYENERYLYFNADRIFFYIFCYIFRLGQILNILFYVEILGFRTQDFAVVLHSYTILSTSVLVAKLLFRIAKITWVILSV